MALRSALLAALAAALLAAPALGHPHAEGGAAAFHVHFGLAQLIALSAAAGLAAALPRARAPRAARALGAAALVALVLVPFV